MTAVVSARPLASSLWTRLSEPHPAITGLEERRQARFISSLLVPLILTGAFFTLVSMFTPLVTVDAFLSNLIPTVALGLVYALSRTRRYRIAGLLTVSIMIIAVYLGVASGSSLDALNTFMYYTLALLMASLILSLRYMLLISAIEIISMMTLPAVFPQLTDNAGHHLFNVTLFVAVSAAFLVIFNLYRNNLERARQQELADALHKTEITKDALAQSNAELEKANHIAQESVRLKSEFMSTMSHELRTPLNAIRGFTGIMLEGMGGEIDDEARHMLKRIESNGERLLNLINDVLDLAKIEAGRMELVKEAFSPRDLVARWQSQMSVLAENKGLTFEVHIDPTLPETLIGDTERLTQITTNLLSNAFKFTHQGSVTLNIRRDGSDCWIIQVSDTGVGIPPHALNYIFEEFRQVDGTTKRSYGGSGLGLAIVRNLIRMMNGNVKATSELGKGSVFTVTLPVITPTPAKQPLLKQIA
jgi:signal transduction histidine kinase